MSYGTAVNGVPFFIVQWGAVLLTIHIHTTHVLDSALTSFAKEGGL
jgi:hypothetical protein